MNRMSWTLCLALSRGDLPDGSGQVLWFRNTHTYPVRLLAVSLWDCVNLRGGCIRDMPADALVFPGQTYEVMTVYAADPSEPFSFRWNVRSQRVR